MPRAATSVATSTVHAAPPAFRKLCIATVLAACDMLPSRAQAKTPCSASILAISRASFLKRTKTKTLALGPNSFSTSRSRRPRAALGSSSTCCSIDGGTPDTAMCTAAGRRASAKASVRGDHVAEKSIVCLRCAANRVSDRISSSKPSSSSLSASSRTRRATRRRRRTGSGAACNFSSCRDREDDGHCPQRASRRPGVATSSAGASDRRDSRCCL
mmetsp:Transcript_135878/g.338877  ORF Transcript_135878/g.338877 Transcript_135878/m.338877 type:complete len:215 (+) Transcript_135878:124-768(+)